jgi:hypothetical protein
MAHNADTFGSSRFMTHGLTLRHANRDWAECWIRVAMAYRSKCGSCRSLAHFRQRLSTRTKDRYSNCSSAIHPPCGAPLVPQFGPIPHQSARSMRAGCDAIALRHVSTGVTHPEREPCSCNLSFGDISPIVFVSFGCLGLAGRSSVAAKDHSPPERKEVDRRSLGRRPTNGPQDASIAEYCVFKFSVASQT